MTFAALLAGSIALQVVAPYVEIVVDGACAGAGVMIQHRDKPRVLTAKHVIQGGQTFAIRRNGKTVQCRVVRSAEQVDLALLRPIGPCPWPTATLPSGKLALQWGERLWTVGTPAGVTRSLSPAWCNGSAIEYRGRRYLRYAGDCWYGNSGGGVYCRRKGKWVLCGIAVMLVDSSNPRSSSYAESLPTIRAFLRSCK
jgi:hypothetical protein